MNNAAQNLKQAKIEPPVHPKGLTPHIVLIASLLYMMSTDGDLAPEEISRLQESVGTDKDAITKARTYIKKNKFDTFLSDSCDVLDKPSQLCILANVYECMLADGVVQKAETKLFQKIQKAYGFNDKTFLKIASVLDTKSNNKLLGSYSSEAAQKHQLTPHMILAASILFMMSADGEVSEEEIGQLSAVVNPYEGLQAAAMSYVEKVSLKEFISGAQNILNAEQRLYVLLNLCDSMLADGVADAREVAIFNQFLEVFGFSEHAFKPHYSVIYIKNVKPFESHDSSVEDANGLFQNIINTDEGGFIVKGSSQDKANDKQMHERIIEDDADGEKIRRTMQENTNNINEGLGGKENIAKVANNANSESKPTLINQEKSVVNLQKANESSKEENVQKVSLDPSAPNLQNVNSGSGTNNTQKIDVSNSKENVQSLQVDKGETNIQNLNQSSAQDNKQSIASQDSSLNVQTLASEKVSDNTAKLDMSNASDNIQTLGTDSENTNKQKLSTEGNGTNVQTLGADDNGTNVQKINAGPNGANNPLLDSKSNNDNVQSIAGLSGAQNQQAIPTESLKDNTQSLSTTDDALNKQKLGVNPASTNKAQLGANSTGINIQAMDQPSQGANTLTVQSDSSTSNTINLKNNPGADNKAKTLQDTSENSAALEKNHVLKNLIKETENSSALERMKNLSGQLKSINAKLNQVENKNRELPVPMDAIESRLDEKLAQASSANAVKVQSANPKPNSASIPIDVFEDHFARDKEPVIESDNFSEPFSLSNDETVSIASDTAKEDLKGELTDELEDQFLSDLEDELRDEFHLEDKNDSEDDFRDDFNSDAENHGVSTLESSVLSNLSIKLNAKSAQGERTSLFGEDASSTGIEWDELLRTDASGSVASPKSPVIQNLSLLDGSLLALQMKGSNNLGLKSSPLSTLTSSKRWKTGPWVYKTIKGSLVFAFIFSWHFYTEPACDMVSCSWSQIGSPVRLDLKQEVVPPSLISPLRIARSPKPSRQV